MTRRLLLSFASMVLSAGLAQAAHAAPMPDFSLTLSNANQSATPGAILTYSGTITNTTSGDLSLNGIQFTSTSFSSVDTACVPGNAPCTDEGPFFTNTPPVLSSGSSFTGILFNVNVPLTSAITYFSGFVDITGGSGTNNALVSTIVGFSTTVTPEPSSWLLMTTGLLGLIVAYRIRLHTSPSILTRL